MRILISIIATTSDHKIKIKSNEALIETLIRTLNKILNKNHMILSNFSDKIKINQKIIFSSKNVIIAEKIIFILNMITQIIQLKTVNSHLIQIEHL